MKTLLPPLTGTLAVLVLILGIVIWRQNRVIGGLHDGVAAVRAENHRLEQEHANAARAHARELEEANETAAQLQRELTVARAAAGLGTERETLATDATLAEHRRRQQRRMVQERYGDLFERLNLSPVKLEELKRLLVLLESPPSTRAAIAAADGTTSPEDALTFADIHDRIYDLLDYEGYSIFDRYTRELTTSRPQVRRFAADAADAGYPLSAVQRSALAQALFEITDPQTNPDAVKPGSNAPDPATGLTPLDQRILAAAADILSSPQVELLRAFRVRERENMAAWRDSLSAPSPGGSESNGVEPSPP